MDECIEIFKEKKQTNYFIHIQEHGTNIIMHTTFFPVVEIKVCNFK